MFQYPGLVRIAWQVIPMFLFLLFFVRIPRDDVVECLRVFAHRHAGISGSRTRDGELALTLQESSVGVDELVRLDITNRDTGHVGGIWRESASSGEVLVVSKSRSASAELDLDIEISVRRREACGSAGARINVSPRRSRDLT